MLKIAFSLIISIAILSCTGPAGPEGYPGRDGKDGNANVRVITFTVKPSDWQKSPEPDMWYFDYPAPLITERIMNSGAVLLYLKDIGGFNSWLALPFTNSHYYQDTIKYLTIYEPWYDAGNIHIQWKDLHPKTPQPPDWNCVIKAVIIEGNPGLSGNLKNIDAKNYNYIKHEFSISD